jgi:hypothetical protein
MRLALALWIALPAIAAAQAPLQLSYQGRVFKADNTPETGFVDVSFAIFDAATEGTSLWTETQRLILTNGFYSTFLGEVTPIPETVFDGSLRYLQVTVSGETLSPRQRIASVAYAVKAQNADKLDGLDANQIMPSGAVMFFNLAACPTGWTALAAARGRYLVGVPTGGTLGGTAGTALTNLEARAAGAHSHTATDSGHSHQYGALFEGSKNVAQGSAEAVDAVTAFTGTTAAASANITVGSTGTSTTPAPYLQLLACQKD